MKKIVIIGAGQLGSRYLQGIAKSCLEASIEVIDPSRESREIAKNRYEEIEKSKSIHSVNFYDSYEKISDVIDLAIIATASDVRLKVLTELLSFKKVSNLVLEKVLFQSVDEYHIAKELFEKTNTKCWVNHPRRMYPFYKRLKEELKGVKKVSYSFQGGDWGMACNGLHFIDHLSYLVDSTDLLINGSFLDNKIYESKRNNFVEFNGMLVGSLSQHLFSLYSSSTEMPATFTISSDTLIAKIDEAKGFIHISKKENDWKWEKLQEKIILFQSELSTELVESILLDEKCSLPTYMEAMKLHIPFVECLLEHMTMVSGKKHKICPIT